MIVIRGAAADAIREARCTNCWPEGINEGVLCLPEEIAFAEVDGVHDGTFTDFLHHPHNDAFKAAMARRGR